MTGAAERTRLAGLAMLAATLGACAIVATPVAHGKKGGGAVNITKTVNLPIPDATEAGPIDLAGVLRSTVEVGKRFKGREIRDVNVTVQTLGTSGATPTTQLRAKLSAPNGAHITLFSGLFPPSGTTNPSIGPLTFDDESPLSLGIENPHSPTELYAPWAGTARPSGKPLVIMDGGPVRGTWTLTMIDLVSMQTSNLVSWGLNVVAGKPFQTK